MASLIAWRAAREILEDAVEFPLVFANEGQQPPGADLFVQVTGRSASGEPGEVGRMVMWTEQGAIECLIHAAVGTSSEAARKLADDIVGAFRAAPPDVVEWVGFSLDEALDPAEGLFWILLLTIRFQTQTIPS